MEEPTTSVYLGNLAPSVTRRHLYEIGIQAGPVVSVSLPQDTTVNKGAINKGFGFVEYQDIEDAKYAVALFRGNLRPTRHTASSSNLTAPCMRRRRRRTPLNRTGEQRDHFLP